MTDTMIVPALTRGSQPNSVPGGCIMQLRNWMRNGETAVTDMSGKVTDYIPSYDRRLNQILIMANDYMCSHTSTKKIEDSDENGDLIRTVQFLCAKCSMKLLSWAEAFDNTWSLSTVANGEDMTKWHFMISNVYSMVRSLAMPGMIYFRKTFDALEELATYTTALKAKYEVENANALTTDEAKERLELVIPAEGDSFEFVVGDNYEVITAKLADLAGKFKLMGEQGAKLKAASQTLLAKKKEPTLT